MVAGEAVAELVQAVRVTAEMCLPLRAVVGVVLALPMMGDLLPEVM